MVRRRYFVRRGMQGRFIAALLALALAGAAATAVATKLSADRVLDEARFRAHFVERSTLDLLLPVLLTVNGIAAAATVVGGIVVALVWFARQTRALDRLCARLGEWQAELESPIGNRQSAIENGPVPRWAADIEGAFREAEGELAAAYRAAAQEASALAADAARLEGAAGDSAAGPKALGDRLGRIESILLRFRCEDRP